MKLKEKNNFRAFTFRQAARLASGAFRFSTDRTDFFLLLYDCIEGKVSVEELSPYGK